MNVLNVLLLVFFVIVAALLILLVLIQNEEGDSLGGIFAGGSGSAFGSRSGNVLTRTTTVLGALFLVLSLSLALINRTPGATGVEAAGRNLGTGVNSDWWQDGEASGTDGEDSEFTINSPADAAVPAPVIIQEDALTAEEASAE
ncbi:MAG: preprotein translocase subunit SecG [Treponema sp.]|jgi:preprotein translocase subunit SecG|nr:preprotein translocase subunit SecG [Treponema sp.]